MYLIYENASKIFVIICVTFRIIIAEAFKADSWEVEIS